MEPLLLTGCVPDLQLDLGLLPVLERQLEILAQKVCADRGFVQRAEAGVHETLHQRGLPDGAVAEDQNLELLLHDAHLSGKMVEAGTKSLDDRGIEPRASRMQSARSTN